MMSLTLPSGEIVYDGAVLRIGDDATNYFLHYGEYTFGEATNCSWYLQAIGTSVAVPITDEMLSKATVMNNGAEVTVHTPVSGCSCHTQPNTIGYEEKEKFTTNDKYILDRTWVTVDTIIERNSLPLGVVINGRVVQVNQSEDGRPHYYRYNVTTMEWDEVTLGDIKTDDDISALQIKVLEHDENLASHEEKISSQEEQLTSHGEKLSSIETHNTSVDEEITQIKEAMDNLSEDINTVTQNLDTFKEENRVIIESIQEKIQLIDESLNTIQTTITSDYYTSSAVDEMMQNYYNREEIDAIIAELQNSI